jgi:hypothetical protein
MRTLADASHKHFADLFVAIERCVFFLQGTRVEIEWPFEGVSVGCPAPGTTLSFPVAGMFFPGIDFCA